MDWNLKIR